MSNLNADLLKTRKTRIEALADRIKEANNYISGLLPNEQEESQVLSSQKLIKKLNNMVLEIKDIQKKQGEMKKEQIKAEIDALPNRSLMELAVSKARLRETCKFTEEELKKRDDSIKNLEVELITQRQELEEKKKEDEKNKELIKNLQQQIAVLRSKVFGYDVNKKYEYYKEKQNKGPVANIEDENLAFAMWEKENYDNRRSRVNTSIENLEGSKNMWISPGNDNVNKITRDADLANSQSRVNGVNGRSGDNYSWRRSNPGERGIGTNMRKYTPMVFNNNN